MRMQGNKYARKILQKWKQVVKEFWQVFVAHFLQMTSLILSPKGPSLGWTTSFKPWSVNICRALQAGPWALEEEKRTVQDWTGKKSQKGYISPIWGEVPIEAIYVKNCVVGVVIDVITCAKVQNEIFWDYDFTGVEFAIFILSFEWAGQQCSARLLCGLWSVVSFFFRNITRSRPTSYFLSACCITFYQSQRSNHIVCRGHMKDSQEFILELKDMVYF